MLKNDSPIIQDLDVSIKYLKFTIDKLNACDKIKFNNNEQAFFMAQGIRQLQRTSVDALTRAYRVLALEIDGAVPKKFDQLVEQLVLVNSKRPAVIRASSKQYLLLSHSLSLSAGLPIMPGSDDVLDFETQKESALIMAGALLILCNDIERMRKWCFDNMTMSANKD